MHERWVLCGQMNLAKSQFCNMNCSLGQERQPKFPLSGCSVACEEEIGSGVGQEKDVLYGKDGIDSDASIKNRVYRRGKTKLFDGK